MKKISKRTKIFTPIVLAIIILVGLGLYLHSSMWLFTPEYSQRQTAESFMSDVYANKMTQAYSQTSTNFMAKNSLSQFTSTEAPLVGPNFQTNLVRYYSGTNGSIITGNIYSLSTSARYTLNFTFAGNKIDSVSVQQI